MNIKLDINIKASEDITNSLLTLAAVLHNAVPIFNENPKVILPKEELNIKNKKSESQNEKVELLEQEITEITAQQVRGILSRISDDGKASEVKALIKKFGATRLTDIPKEKYGELLKEANLIN